MAATVRCAIYTRKSTEEGLSQAFNSLDAQREAAEAYIRSQQEQGWMVVPERYDDGGCSGASLDRPALQRLLADAERGRIDCVVVYKVDRLSRSLLDFARIIDRFERRSVSFVSVTQQFNTTASLGRLTLNILLSFAQFERELIAERTRDKMSAARRKGKWGGGIPVLGYDVAAEGGRLVVNAAEAEQVRAIFDLYLEHGSLAAVVEQLGRQGWTTKRWRSFGGRPYSVWSVDRLLSNVIYSGRIRHKGVIYPGEHAAIIAPELWERVDEQRRAGQKRSGHSRRSAEPGKSKPATTADEANGEGKMHTRVPRVARVLALALECEQLLARGEVRSCAELARLGQVSRPRMTQIMNLLHLAPDIQESILFLEPRPGAPPLRMTDLQPMLRHMDWDTQRELWQQLQRH
jgi:DNA invertase Pin-like site-specific DNA recombinase